MCTDRWRGANSPHTLSKVPNQQLATFAQIHLHVCVWTMGGSMNNTDTWRTSEPCHPHSTNFILTFLYNIRSNHFRGSHLHRAWSPILHLCGAFLTSFHSHYLVLKDIYWSTLSMVINLNLASTTSSDKHTDKVND